MNAPTTEISDPSNSVSKWIITVFGKALGTSEVWAPNSVNVSWG